MPEMSGSSQFMMLGLPGGPELIVLLVIVVVLFGGGRIREVMRGAGEGLKEFRKATRDDHDESAEESAKPAQTKTP